jgi:hypothetical protein
MRVRHLDGRPWRESLRTAQRERDRARDAFELLGENLVEAFCWWWAFERPLLDDGGGERSHHALGGLGEPR